jgi:hypothetical protein
MRPRSRRRWRNSIVRVTFVRTVGAKDSIYVAREGGEVSWEFPSYGDELPHDLVHLVVESRFGVNGVWANVAAGADLAAINAASNRGDKAGYRAMGEGTLVAEALANAPWTRFEEAPDAAAVRARMVEMYAALPASVTEAAIERVRSELFALRERWRALAPKGALALDYPLPDAAA